MQPAPKDRLANSAYRRELLKRAATDNEFKHEVWIRASRDLVWFSDSLCWTFSPKDTPDTPDLPFVLWDYQEEQAAKINAAIGRTDLLIEKSRDMGATWLVLLVFVWRWLFKRRQTFLLLSRKEDLVDKRNDPDSIMWKADYLLANLPGWMVPHTTRNKLLLHNEDNNSSITGESTNSDASRGGRRTAIMLDEFAAVDDGYPILSASRDATNCRIFNSTPAGAGGAYYDTRQKMMQESPECVLRMHWSMHPERKTGLYTAENGLLRVIDQNYRFPSEYKFILDGKLRSPYYDLQCRRAAHPQEIATQLDIDYAGSGWPAFDRTVLDDLIAKHTREPLYCGELTHIDSKPEWMECPGGRLRLWVELDANGRPPRGSYVVGDDVATGKGGDMSSNSVATIANRATRELVGEFVTNTMRPADFCDYSVAICRFFHEAFFIWEENGPGGEVTARLKETHYRNVFYREDESLFIRKKTKKPGFWSSPDSKRVLLTNYMSGLLNDRFINRSAESLGECGEYVKEPNGNIVHVKAKNSIDPNATGAEHGDRVISAALCYRGFSDVPVPDETPEAQFVPPNSFLGRRQALEHKRQTAGAY